MALRTLDERDVKTVEFIKRNDPFQHACLSLRQVWFMLPPELTKIVITDDLQRRIEENKLMALKVVDVAAAPDKMFKRGQISQTSDYIEVMAALKTTTKSQAIVVQLSDPKFTEVKDGKPVIPKPETAFGYSLRRHFEDKGLPLVAYQSGKMQVTIRHMTATEQAQRGKGRKK